MPMSIVVPLGAFLVMVGVFVVVARRTGQVIAETREADAFRRSVEDLALRVDISLGGVVERVDAVRRHQVPPDGIDDSLQAALEAIERYAGEASDLGGPASATGLKIGLRAELERAGRALRMVEHGCLILSTGRGIGRDTEGETAVKRGYLNLLHAREAVADYAAEIVETRGGIEPRWYSRRPPVDGSRSVASTVGERVPPRR